MEKRFILFIVLSFLLMVFYPIVVTKMGWAPPPRTEADKLSAPPKGRIPDAAAKDPSAKSDSAPGLKGLVEEKTVHVETPLYKATLSTRGGSVTRWELKKYTSPDKSKPIILYEKRPGGTSAFSIKTGDTQLAKRLDEELYAVEDGDLFLDENKPSGQLRFEYIDSLSGARLAKKFFFSAEDYRVVMETEISGFQGDYEIHLGTDFGITDWGAEGGFMGFIGPITRLGDDLLKDSVADAEKPIRHQGAVAWTALQDKYFIAAAVPDSATAAVISRPNPKSVDGALAFKTSDGGATRNRIIFFAGPKEHDRLKALGVKLEETVDFGWFMFGSWAMVRFIAEPIFYILRFIQEYIGNYGAAIILLTVGVKLLFVPLTHKSYKSMKAMQVLQPQVQALQSKYKDDRQRLQREMLELYQKNKVNPLGGCLPILLQIPVFVALFNVLYTTIELRQAPFMLWVNDLSTMDPYYVLPVLMGISMVVQQLMQPTTMDPVQAKFMLAIPVLMTFLFVTFPSGLVLYMITNNLLTMGQQFITMKFLEVPRDKTPETKKPGKKTAG